MPTASSDRLPNLPTGTGSPIKLPPKWRYPRYVAIIAVVVLLCAVWHGSILRGIAAPLIVDQRRHPAAALFILDGDRRFDVASQRVAGGTKSILIRRQAAGRLERMGIIPSAEDLARRELKNRHIGDQQLEMLSDRPVTNQQIPECLGEWLGQHPGEDIDVLCDRFESWRWDRLLRQLDVKTRSRIHIVALPDREFDERDWWLSKRGTLAVLNGYLRLMFHCCQGDSHHPRRERGDDEFSYAFRKTSS